MARRDVSACFPHRHTKSAPLQLCRSIYSTHICHNFVLTCGYATLVLLQCTLVVFFLRHHSNLNFQYWLHVPAAGIWTNGTAYNFYKCQYTSQQGGQPFLACSECMTSQRDHSTVSAAGRHEVSRQWCSSLLIRRKHYASSGLDQQHNGGGCIQPPLLHGHC